MSDVEPTTEPLRAKVAFFWGERHPDDADVDHLGLLGRMVKLGASLIEHNSMTPGNGEFSDAVLKAQYLRRQCIARNEPRVGRVWLISPGRPSAELERYGCEPAPSPWPSGVYFSPEGFGLAVVVLPELPAEPSTLTLRLLGRGRVLGQAWEESKARFTDAPERAHLVAMMRHAPTMLEASIRGTVELDNDELRVFREAMLLLLEGEAQQTPSSKLLSLFELRLGRPLTPSERTAVDALANDTLARAVLDHDAAGLAAWLAEHDG